MCIGQVYLVWLFKPRAQYTTDYGFVAKFSAENKNVSLAHLVDESKRCPELPEGNHRYEQSCP